MGLSWPFPIKQGQALLVPAYIGKLTSQKSVYLIVIGREIDPGCRAQLAIDVYPPARWRSDGQR